MKNLAMISYICLFLFCSLFYSACVSYEEEQCSIGEIVLNEFLSTNTMFFPLDNLEFLNEFRKPVLINECEIDIDSIIEFYSESRWYNEKIISDLKLRSIYI